MATESAARFLVEPRERSCSSSKLRKPLYPNVREAAVRDQMLYEWLALADALRLGQGRVSAAAKEAVHRRINQLRNAVFTR